MKSGKRIGGSNHIKIKCHPNRFPIRDFIKAPNGKTKKFKKNKKKKYLCEKNVLKSILSNNTLKMYDSRAQLLYYFFAYLSLIQINITNSNSCFKLENKIIRKVCKKNIFFPFSSLVTQKNPKKRKRKKIEILSNLTSVVFFHLLSTI